MTKRIMLTPCGRMTALWQIRLAAVTAVVIAVGLELFGYSVRAGLIVALGATAVFGLIGGLYLPAYMKRFSYVLEGGRLTVVRGLFAVKIGSLELSAASAVYVRSTPLMRVFKVRRLCVVYPRGRLVLPALSVTEAASLAAEVGRI